MFFSQQRIGNRLNSQSIIQPLPSAVNVFAELINSSETLSKSDFCSLFLQSRVAGDMQSFCNPQVITWDQW